MRVHCFANSCDRDRRVRSPCDEKLFRNGSHHPLLRTARRYYVSPALRFGWLANFLLSCPARAVVDIELQLSADIEPVFHIGHFGAIAYGAAASELAAGSVR
jgi:hypothetical protein